MKHFFATATLGILLMVLGVGVLPGNAQSDGGCSEDVVDDIRDWEEDEVPALLQGFEEVAEDASDIETAASLQALRREFDDEDVPVEAAEVKALFVRMIDLRTDAIIATYLEEDHELVDDLLDDAEDTLDDALELLSGLCPSEPSGELAQIVSPADGDQVDQETRVEGTYDRNVLGEDQLWVVLLFASNGLYYPQVNMDPSSCDKNTASSVTYGPSPDAWQIMSYVDGVGPTYAGREYDIILYTADPTEHDAMLDLMEDWCRHSPQNHPGITDPSSPPYGFEYVASVHVTRR
jgi:hypothetical protein